MTSAEGASARRPGPWWLLPPALLFAGNMLAVVAWGSQGEQNGVYRGVYLAAAALTAGMVGGYALVAPVGAGVPARRALAVVRPKAGWGRLAGLAFAAILILNLALDPLLQSDKAQGITPDHRPASGRDWALLGLALVLLGVVVPVAEELLFRGLAFAALGRYGVVGSAALFAVAHALPRLLPVVFVAGLVLAELRRRTGSVLPGMAVHGLLNTTGILLALLTA